MTLSIVIPAYNEAKTLNAILNAILICDMPHKMNKEIIVVDDGSSDKTPAILSAYKKNPSIKLHRLNINQGKTTAVLHGIKHATGDFVLIQDADLEYLPNNYPLLLDPILKNQTQVVYGSRFLGQPKNMKWINQLANYVSNITFNILFQKNINDINTCFKLFKRELIQSIPIKSKHFGFESEITAKLVKQGIKIIEVPIEYSARTTEDGKKMNWPLAIKLYGGIWKYRFTN